MSEAFPYKGKDIERATNGYVNSGVLRSWLSEGRLTAGGRKSDCRGGPRTFNWQSVLKVAVMAELRKCGVALDKADAWASLFVMMLATAVLDLADPAELHTIDVGALDIPFYYAVNPESGEVTPISGDEAAKKFDDVVAGFGSSVVIIGTLSIINAVIGALPSKPDTSGDTAA